MSSIGAIFSIPYDAAQNVACGMGVTDAHFLSPHATALAVRIRGGDPKRKDQPAPAGILLDGSTVIALAFGS